MSYEEEDNDSKKPIIIDNGSGYIKAGLNDEEGPRSIFPSIVGYQKYAYNYNFYREKKDYLVGSEAEAKRGVLKLNYPIEHGNIENWDDMEIIWNYIFTNEL